MWHLGGKAWDAMIKYQMYTKDTKYQQAIQTAMTRNMERVPNGKGYRMARVAPEGEEKVLWWIYPALTAMESGFPPPECPGETVSPGPAGNLSRGVPGKVSPASGGKCAITWQSLATAAFDEYVERWHAESDTCGGGLRWQLENPGYKGTPTNGGFFQIAARLARHTGNATFADWATAVWEWTGAVGFLRTGDEYHVFDGAEDRNGRACSRKGYFDVAEYSHNLGLYLHGAAHMYAYARGGAGASANASAKAGAQPWEKHVAGLVKRALGSFASAYEGENNATAREVVYEPRCELRTNCDEDQMSFKGTLVAALSRTMLLVPSVQPSLEKLVNATSMGASKGCSAKPEDKNACGFKWFTGSWDHVSSFGAQVSSLEAILGASIGSAPLYNATTAS
jgi:mannan endo-1,6-alpha-mannosidase